LLQYRARAAVFLLDRLVGIGDGAEEHLLARIAFGMLDRRPRLHVDELSPGFGMVGENALDLDLVDGHGDAPLQEAMIIAFFIA
jgi:hypothetical protein